METGTCQRCNSSRVAHVNGKVSDMCYIQIDDMEHDGYVPHGSPIGGGDYLEFEVCLDCGQMQGTWPAQQMSMEISDGE